MSSWHTALLARCSVLYLPATGIRKQGTREKANYTLPRAGKRGRGWRRDKEVTPLYIAWLPTILFCNIFRIFLWKQEANPIHTLAFATLSSREKPMLWLFF